MKFKRFIAIILSAMMLFAISVVPISAEKMVKAAPFNLEPINTTSLTSNDGMIKNVDTTMEYKFGNGNYTEILSSAIAINDGFSYLINLAPGKYYIRYKETETHLASPAIEVEIKGPCAHNWKEITSSATCTSDGSTSYVCTLCNANKSEYASATGHTFTHCYGQYDAATNSIVVYDYCTKCNTRTNISYQQLSSSGNSSTQTTIIPGITTTTTPVTSITLNTTALSLKKGESFALTATVLPLNATDKTIKWTATNARVAKIENGVITALDEGECDILVVAGSCLAECKLVVMADPEEEQPPVVDPSTSSEENNDGNSNDSSTEIPSTIDTSIKNLKLTIDDGVALSDLAVAKTYTISLSYDSELSDDDITIEWSSSDKSALFVPSKDKKSANIAFIKDGITIVVVKVNGEMTQLVLTANSNQKIENPNTSDD